MSKRIMVIDKDGNEKDPGLLLANIKDTDKVFRKRRGKLVEIPKRWLGKTPKFGIMMGGWISKYNVRPRKISKNKRGR